MFDRLTSSFSAALNALTGRGHLTDENIADTVRQVRLALLDADVALPVVKNFTDAIKARAVGVEIAKSLTPGQAFIKVVHEELVRLMGEASSGLNLRAQRPVVVMLAGLQGAGKTTTAAKLARLLVEREHKRVLLASTDVRRPAAMLQLERLAAQVHAEYFPAPAGAAPAEIARAALERSRNGVFDALIIDTAGRLHVDEALMAEVRDIDAAVRAAERLFVVDAMAGQDAVNAARAFGAALDLTGIILTKADGDARGGAALSVRQITGKPIVFLGIGEKTEALELFDPERMAARILGMGDVVSLVEQVHRQVDHAEAQRLAQKLVKGKSFDMADLKSQLEQLQKMGGVGALLDKLPGAVAKKGAVSPDQGDQQLRRQIAIINSMTPRERRSPSIIDGSRRRRIAKGSGVQVQDVNRLLKQFMEMQRVMKSMKGGRLRQLMSAFKGGLPPGFPGR
jgi:signal recognition particle subunit SRP54